MLKHWKLTREVVKLHPRLLAKVLPKSKENPYKSVPQQPLWAIVIAEKNGKYLCLYGPHRKWLDKTEVRIL